MVFMAAGSLWNQVLVGSFYVYVKLLIHRFLYHIYIVRVKYILLYTTLSVQLVLLVSGDRNLLTTPE